MTHTHLRRVAVTGMGAVCPLGNAVEESWQALLAGHTGVGAISRFDTTDHSCTVAAEVKGFAATPENTGMGIKELRDCDLFSHYGLAAAWQAMGQAGLRGLKDMPAGFRERVQVWLASGIGGLETLTEAQDTLREKGPRRVSPKAMVRMLGNLAAGRVASQYGALGLNLGVVSACASGAHAIGLAMQHIQLGEADVALAGGAEASITPLGIAAFANMHALATTFNDTPAAASRPLDAARSGFVMGEGAAMLVLEAEEHAKARGATILGYVDGFAATSDAADSMTSPNGEGAARAMRMALHKAGLVPDDIGYINPHATSTPAGDEVEAATIHALFGSHTPLSATKGATGHLLGAAGALEAVFSLLVLRDKLAPPTVNLHNPLRNDLDILAGTARPLPQVRAVLSNSFGFGGTNASLVFTAA